MLSMAFSQKAAELPLLSLPLSLSGWLTFRLEWRLKEEGKLKKGLSPEKGRKEPSLSSEGSTRSTPSEIKMVKAAMSFTEWSILKHRTGMGFFVSYTRNVQNEWPLRTLCKYWHNGVESMLKSICTRQCLIDILKSLQAFQDCVFLLWS